MPFRSIGLQLGREIESCLDLEQSGLESGTPRLDQRISDLFKRLHGPVFGYLMVSLNDAAEAEEVTQESFLRLYDALHSGQAVSNVRAWVYRVAHNLAVNLHKERRFVAGLDAEVWPAICNSHLDPRPNPEERLLQQEKYQRLQKALNMLPVQQQQCLLLRAEGFRTKEIAEVLGVNTWTAAKSLHRGIKRMHREIHD